MSRGVAVVIPALNEEEMIAAAIVSARSAGASEIIVVDGGSTDRTVEVARTAGALVIEFRGVRGRQANAGAAASISPILLFLHADSELPSDAITSIRDAVRQNAEFGAFRLKFREPGLRLRIASLMINLRCRFTNCPWGDQGQWITRDAFEQTGGFSEDPIMEDYEMALRMKRRGRTRILRSSVTTSGRRFLRMGVLRTAWVNWKVILLWRFGVHPEKLATMYRGDGSPSGSDRRSGT